MSSRSKILFWVFVVAVLALFGNALMESRARRDTRRDERAQWAAEHAATLQAAQQAGAKPIVIKAGGHELLVVDVPVESGRSFVTRQRCFVWRDAEFKTATMSCPSGADRMDFDDSWTRQASPMREDGQ